MKRNRSDTLIKNTGFTLLEILVAVSILAIVLTVVYKVHFQSMVMTQETKFHAVAPMLAELRLAEFEKAVPGEFHEDSGDFGDRYPGYVWRLTVTDVESTILTDDAERLKRVDVTVALDNDSHVYQLRSYLPKDRDEAG